MNFVRRRHGAAAAAALVVVVLVTLSSSLVGGKIFGSGDNIFQWAPFSSEAPAEFVRPSNFLLTDPVQGFIPDLIETRSDLSHGVLPLWNPDAAGGRPLLASQVHAPLFPLTWLAFLLPFWSSFAWIAAGKLLLAAGGTYLFVRDLGLQRGPSLLAALAFAFGMYFVVWLEHPQTYVWLCLPWMFLATLRACRYGSLAATALLGVSTGLACLGGHPESAAFLIAATAAYAVFELVAERIAGPNLPTSFGRSSGPSWTGTLVGRAGLVGCGLVLGIGLSAVVTLPLLELLHQSGSTERGGPALPLNALYSFAFPELWGMPTKFFSSAGPVNFNERTAYIGALPTLFAIGALGRDRPREQWFFVAIALVSLAVTFNVPLLATGIRRLPDANVARLTRFLVVLSFAGAVLGAYGLQRWIGASMRERKRMSQVMVAAALLPAAYWVAMHTSALTHLGAALGQIPAIGRNQGSQAVVELGAVWRWTLICGLGLGGLWLVFRRNWSPTAAVVLTVVLTAADLVALDRGYHGSIPLAEANPTVPEAIRYLASHQGDARVVGTDYALPPSLGERYGLRDARVGIDIPYPKRYQQLWTALGGISGDQTFLFARSHRAHLLADLFAVRYALIPPGGVRPGWLHPVLHTVGGTVAINPTALPRAWVAYGWRTSRSRASALAMTVASSTHNLRDQPIIEGAPNSRTSTRPSTAASVSHDSGEEVGIHATAKAAGYLVLDDSAYPGWVVTVDGRSAPWYPANENFRAVAIPAGSHTVVFRYRPTSVRDGAIVSVASVLMLVALALVGAFGMRRRQETTGTEGPVSESCHDAGSARTL